jgi:hypothetical protein
VINSLPRMAGAGAAADVEPIRIEAIRRRIGRGAWADVYEVKIAGVVVACKVKTKGDTR